MSPGHHLGHVHALVVQIVGQGVSVWPQAGHRHFRLLNALLENWLKLLPLYLLCGLPLLQHELLLLLLHVVLVLSAFGLLLLLLLVLVEQPGIDHGLMVSWRGSFLTRFTLFD